MKTTALRLSCIAALLLAPAAFAAHLSDLTARITLPDGTTRMAKLEGLGCSWSICSRVAIKGKTDGDSLVSFWLDSITAIKDTTENGALLAMKDGTQHRMSLVTDFRVLYTLNRSGGTEKLDLSKIRSLEFLPATK